MRRVFAVLSLLLATWLGLGWSSAPAWAASSAAIRAFDDVQGVVKNYAGQNLQLAEFGDAKLADANFKGADLRGAVFNGAILSRANWQGVDFSDGIAYITDFGGADLSNGIFNSAMMLKSNLRDVKITGADFSDAVLDRDQVVQLCQIAEGTNPVTGVRTRESLECK
jgi:uncharacterized protein YjbI with pentapeptide repeats